MLASNTRASPQPGHGRHVRGEHRVLIVDDNQEYLAILHHELAARGFEVRSFTSAEDLLAFMPTKADADLLILDWMLPGMNGIELLSRLQNDGCRMPVVFLTSVTHSENEDLALDKGAVDFVPKIRGVDVLARRMSRILERGEVSRRPDDARSEGELILHTSMGRAEWRGVDVGLTICEFNVVDQLTSSEGRPLSHRTIYDRVHYAGFIAGTGDNGYRCNVRSIIKRLRAKFRHVDPGFDAISNHAGEGYSWKHLVDNS